MPLPDFLTGLAHLTRDVAEAGLPADYREARRKKEETLRQESNVMTLMKKFGLDRALQVLSDPAASPDDQSAAQRQIGAAAQVGLGITHEGASFKPPSANTMTIPTMVFDPVAGTYTHTGMVPKGTVVRNKTSLEDATALSEAKARGSRKGRGFTPEAATTLSSAESAQRAIDELLTMEQKTPGALQGGLVASLPGARPFSSEQSQTVRLLLKRLQTEITTARGGKQLTQAEMRFIGQLLPNLFNKGQVNIKSLTDLRGVLENVRSRIQGENESPSARHTSSGMGYTVEP